MISETLLLPVLPLAAVSAITTEPPLMVIAPVKLLAPVSFISRGTSPGEAYTEIVHAKIVHRYVLSLEVNRGPVGSRVSVLGRGFTPQDVVYFSGTPARIRSAS